MLVPSLVCGDRRLKGGNVTSNQATDLACTVLADELGCTVDDLQVLEVESVEWSDSSLGCAQPGMMYMQVITPGYRITLQHGAQRYVIHTDRGHRAVRCDRLSPGQVRPRC